MLQLNFDMYTVQLVFIIQSSLPPKDDGIQGPHSQPYIRCEFLEDSPPSPAQKQKLDVVPKISRWYNKL